MNCEVTTFHPVNPWCSSQKAAPLPTLGPAFIGFTIKCRKTPISTLSSAWDERGEWGVGWVAASGGAVVAHHARPEV